MINGREVIRVWGTADNFDIEFTHEGGNTWKCVVPPDTSDGVYAVELFAINKFGKTAHWVGELFMSGGICHLSIEEPNYKLWFGSERVSIEISEETSQMVFTKGCPHKMRR